MQKGTQQSEEARKAISVRMKERWDKVPRAKRSKIAKASAAKRIANKKV